MTTNPAGYPRRPTRANVSPDEYQLIQRLRARNPAKNPPKSSSELGARLADKVAEVVGSWQFVITQSLMLFLWIAFNSNAYIQHWDGYPFILLNLMLSFQAAYTAPIIMMSQNRQAAIDRAEAKHDHEVNLKSELEIELLHDKFNLLREAELAEMITLLQEQRQSLQSLEAKLGTFMKSAEMRPVEPGQSAPED